MSAEPPAALPGCEAILRRARGWDLSRVRLVPALEASPRLVVFAQTWAGRLVVAASFATLAFVAQRRAVAFAVLPALFPGRRRVAVGVATLAAALLVRRDELAPLTAQLDGGRWLAPAAVLAGWLLTIGYVQLAKTHGARWLARRPVLTLLAIYAALVVAVSATGIGGTAGGACWTFLAAWGGYLWYAAYSLKDRPDRRGTTLVSDASAYHPFWGGSNTPFPKAGAALAKIEVKSTSEAAVWQLKAIKLLVWAMLLDQGGDALASVASGTPSLASRWLALPNLHVPAYSAALAMSAAGTPYPASTNWLALVVEFLRNLVTLSVWGHGIVAGARMAGFKALRNTYRPLEARSIADFWNRYYFYFKELLVDFFFFPAFVRYFKKHARIRLLFATFAAAGFGNFLYHFLRDTHLIASHGVVGALWRSRAYALYCALLALAIGVSQLRRPQGPPRAASWVSRAASAVAVLGVYCLLSIPGDARPGTSLAQVWAFLVALLPHP